MAADTLALWGYTRDLPIAQIDFGTLPYRSSGDIRVRVKNRSGQYQANGVVVSVEDVTADAAGQLLLSLDGVTFTAAVAIGDLPAAAISPVVWLRRVTAS